MTLLESLIPIHKGIWELQHSNQNTLHAQYRAFAHISTRNLKDRILQRQFRVGFAFLKQSSWPSIEIGMNHAFRTVADLALFSSVNAL